MKFRSRYVRDYLSHSKMRRVLVWGVQILAVVLLALVTAVLFFQTVTMQEGSMEPTIQAGQKVCINTMAYKLGTPKRGDLIAFEAGGDEEHSSIHVKRIIGLPGDTVQIRDGEIYVNEELYETDLDLGTIENPGLAEGGVTVGSNEYFVLGDNRNNSEDSRFTQVGVIHRDDIVGRAWLRIYPFDRIGFIRHQ